MKRGHFGAYRIYGVVIEGHSGLYRIFSMSINPVGAANALLPGF